MQVELRVPTVGESVTEVQVGGWLVKPGDHVERDQAVVVIETDKATVEIPAPAAGSLTRILKAAGAKVKPGEVLALLEQGAPASATASGERASLAARPASSAERSPKVMPAAARLLAERGMTPADVAPSGPGGRLVKEDVQRAIEPMAPAPARSDPRPAPSADGGRATEVVAMSPLRRTVARRLLEAQRTAALLTTFNEIDLGAVIELRKQHGEGFRQKHGVKLGFMSFFVKAAVDALGAVPAVNAQIRSSKDGAGDEIVYHHYCDVGVAVGGGKGLVVPVIRDAERLSFAEVERQIADFAARAEQNRLSLEELAGGTFTISNGGVYGSLLSTPIVNPPQSGVLGLHAIVDRPVARAGQVVIRPMMYVALTYDHRLVDGREAVTFLKRVKDCVESPARMLLEI